MPNNKNKIFCLSVLAWLEKIAKKEIEKQWWEIIETIDRLITFKWSFETAAKVNLWSRVGNKLYLLLAVEDEIEDFDDLYWLVNIIDFEKIRKKDFPIVVKATSIRSKLHHTPSIQSITKKSIVDRLSKYSNNIWNIKEDSSLEKFEVLVLMINDKARILLNLSWEALHKRWYRKVSWEAPIKESLASGLVLLSSWNFRENFYDIFCGSGTIVIEAAMIARNVAPGLKRKFSIVDLDFVSEEQMKELKALAREKKFDWKYNIFWFDIDENVLEIAKQNAINAWVWDTIVFEKKDFRDFKNKSWVLLTNPPYWLRLKTNLEELYKSLNNIFLKNPELKGWFISNFLEFDNLIGKRNFYKKRKLYNWAEMCYFWKKK